MDLDGDFARSQFYRNLLVHQSGDHETHDLPLVNKQIAAELGTSEVTIKVHRGQLMRKMRARSLPELVRMAGTLGIPAVQK